MPGGRRSAGRVSVTGLRFRRGSPPTRSGAADDAPPPPCSAAASAADSSEKKARCASAHGGSAGAGAAYAHADSAQQPLDIDALVRCRYYAHVTTQVLLSNLPPWMFLLFTLQPRAVRLSSLSRFEMAVTVSCFTCLLMPITASLLFKLRGQLPARLRLSVGAEAAAFRAVIIAEWLSYCACTVPLCAEFVLGRGALNCDAGGAGTAAVAAAASPGACALVFGRTFNAARGYKCVVTQLPARLAFAPEALKQALFAACALVAHASEGALTPAAALATLAHAAAALCATMLLVTLHTDPQFADRYVPSGLDACPRALRPAREALLAACVAACRRVAAPPLDYRALSGLAVCANLIAGRLFVSHTAGVISFAMVGRTSHVIYGMLTLGSLSATWLSGGGTLTLGGMAQRLGVDRDRASIERLNAALAGGADVGQAGEGAVGGTGAAVLSERDTLLVALAQLRQLFPAASGLALGTFAEDEPGDGAGAGAGHEGQDELAHFGLTSECVAALYGPATSVECVASQPRTLIADSRDFPGGLTTFADWEAARADATCRAAVAITAPLPAGPAKVGFLTLRFDAAGAQAAGAALDGLLLAACHVIGEHLYARRERAALATSRALANDIYPEHVVRVLERRTRRTIGMLGGSGGLGAASALAPPGRAHSPPRRSSSLPEGMFGAAAAALAAAAEARSPRSSSRTSGGVGRGSCSPQRSPRTRLSTLGGGATSPASPFARSPPQDGQDGTTLALSPAPALRAQARSSAPEPFAADDTGGPEVFEAPRRASASMPVAPRHDSPQLVLAVRAAAAHGSTCSSPTSMAAAAAEEEEDLFAEQHDCLTVCFVDIVQFTALAEGQSAAATMRTLHALFSRFDALCELLLCYKIETIGDCYMLVAGMLPRMEPAAAAAAALRFALLAHGAAAACGLRVRAGLHSGPVTSGLIGQLRARFCLFGDTVNVASRMESSGVAGHTQASGAAWALTGLPQEGLATKRSLRVKGKAEEMDVFVLDAASPAAADVVARLEAAAAEGWNAASSPAEEEGDAPAEDAGATEA